MMDRAAQFSPFAALTGYDAAIKETGRLTDEKIEMDEEALNILNMKFQILVDSLDDEPEVTFTYGNRGKPKTVYTPFPQPALTLFFLSAFLPIQRKVSIFYPENVQLP